MTINDIAKASGLTRRAVKFYEEKGLLSVPKDANGYRNYTPDHLRVLKAISVYRKLNVSIKDIQRIIQHGDDSILLQVMQAKESELQDKQAELQELKDFISRRDIDQAGENLEYATVAQAIRDAVPGFYGRYFLHHFEPYLQMRIQTEEQRKAYQAIIAFWDDTDIKIPLLLRVTGNLMLRLLPEKTPEQMERIVSESLQLYLDPDPETYEKLKQTVLDGYQQQRRRFHPLQNAQRRLMKELQNKGYHDIFIPYMKILSPAYRQYHDALTRLNSRICTELGLYYDASYHLVMKP